MWIVALLGSQVLLHACGVCQLLPSWHPGALGLSKLPVVAQPIERMDVELPLLQPGPHIYVLASFFAISTSKWRQICLCRFDHQIVSTEKQRHVLGTATIVYHILPEFQ